MTDGALGADRMEQDRTEPEEPRELTPEEISRLVERINQHFYRASPHMYFHQRAVQLMMAAADPEKLLSAIGDGIKLGGLTLGPASGDRPTASPLADEDTRQQYLAIESTALLHHAAESLLRLYLAHEARSPCPWIDMTLVRYDFKRKLQARFPKGGAIANDEARLFPVFYFARSREGLRFANDELEPDLANISGFLHHFAHMHLDEAPVYNAAKHGLGVVGGETGLVMEGVFDWRSLSLVAPVVKGGKPASMLFRSVNVERDITFTHVATELMRQLWDVAKTRYLGEPLPEVNMFVAPRYRDVLLSGKAFGIDHLDMPLWMWSAPAHSDVHRADDAGGASGGDGGASDEAEEPSTPPEQASTS